MKENKIKIEGIVVQKLPNCTFRVKLNVKNNPTILTYLSGRLKKNKIFIDIKDWVVVELSPYDLSKGRIIYRK